MEVEPSVVFQPTTHFGMLVGLIVVQNHVHIEPLQGFAIEALEKPKKLLVPEPKHALSDHGAVQVSLAPQTLIPPLPPYRGRGTEFQGEACVCGWEGWTWWLASSATTGTCATTRSTLIPSLRRRRPTSRFP